MLRLRRYRIFWILAVFAIGTLYHFKAFRDREGNNVGGLKNFRLQHEFDTPPLEGIAFGTNKLRPQKEEVREQEQKQEQEIRKSKGQEILHDNTPATSDVSESPTTPNESESPTTSNGSESSTTSNGPESPTTSDKLESPASSVSISPSEKSLDLAADPNNEEKGKPIPDGTLDALPKVSAPAVISESSEEPGKGRVEVSIDSLAPKIYWSKMPEHFPIPSASIIQLPTGIPKSLPKIQYVFTDESASDKMNREQKLGKIEKTFEISWAGYKERAWMQDELSPVSGKHRNPFCGWAATLVDSLDTLWIMGMKEEFEKAVNAVKDIDFTTSARDDIPLFETVIRYLGGLLAAYDLSGGTYGVLLEKAVELAEILMGAFDTPNRMPITYYYWKPEFASKPRRAHTKVVLAELGSLSLEFTRLAQLTQEPKYYDAIARITNEFAAWQNNTKVPGLWPMKVDASGCKKPEVTSTLKLPTSRTETGDAGFSNEQAAKVAGLEKPSLEENATAVDAVASEKFPSVDDLSHSNVGNVKRQLGEEDLKKGTTLARIDVNDMPACEPQGLASPPDSTTEEFLIGGQADSVYEYLPKEYMLLGGLEDSYRTMYEMAVEVTKKYLLFRPMVPEGKNVLLSGSLRTSGHLDDPADLSLNPEGTHLTCFAGGMFAIGAKIFNREGDMDIARKLTDGCVWAYEATTTGIMPERYLAVPCQNQEHCDWNETLYHEMVHTFADSGQRQLKTSQQTVLFNKNLESNPKIIEESDQIEAAEAKQSKIGPDAEAIPTVTGESGAHETRVSKRQLVDAEKEKPLKAGSKPAGAQTEDNIPTRTTLDEGKSETEGKSEESISDVEQSPKKNDTSAGHANSSPPNPTLKESSEARIREGRLPAGMTEVTSSVYILRPEAIESVFIMYRITGDNYWREKGWAMFEAIIKHTATNYGASGIKDVTSDTPLHSDMMESFWLAETLKYFYLLFSDPELISLDDYVLNTEAHPFKRPK